MLSFFLSVLELSFNKIVVSSNCQTGGVAQALRVINGSYVFQAIPIPMVGNESAEKFLVDNLLGADYWVSSGRFELADGIGVKIIRLPEIYFDAFHPDLCYAKSMDSGELTKIHYNSRIAVWAYSNGLPTDVCARLFSDAVFRELGYFDCWARAVSNLSKIFSNCLYDDAEFLRFFLKIKRTGVFMHSVNHPRSAVLVELARLISSKFVCSGAERKDEIIISDALNETIWPVYPSVAGELGLDGSHCWRINGDEISDVRNYLDFAYRSYDQQFSTRRSLALFHPDSRADTVLFNALDYL